MLKVICNLCFEEAKDDCLNVTQSTISFGEREFHADFHICRKCLSIIRERTDYKNLEEEAENA